MTAAIARAAARAAQTALPLTVPVRELRHVARQGGFHVLAFAECEKTGIAAMRRYELDSVVRELGRGEVDGGMGLGLDRLLRRDRDVVHCIRLEDEVTDAHIRLL